VCATSRSTRGAQRVYTPRTCLRARGQRRSAAATTAIYEQSGASARPAAEIISLEIGRRTKEPGRPHRSHISFTTRCTIGIKSFRSSSSAVPAPLIYPPLDRPIAVVTESPPDRAYIFSPTPSLPVGLIAVRRSVVVSLGRLIIIMTTAFRAAVHVDRVYSDSIPSLGWYTNDPSCRSLLYTSR